MSFWSLQLVASSLATCLQLQLTAITVRHIGEHLKGGVHSTGCILVILLYKIAEPVSLCSKIVIQQQLCRYLWSNFWLSLQNLWGSGWMHAVSVNLFVCKRQQIFYFGWFITHRLHVIGNLAPFTPQNDYRLTVLSPFYHSLYKLLWRRQLTAASLCLK